MSPFEIGGGEYVNELLTNLADELAGVFLLIIVEIFELFLVFLQNLIAGQFIENPAVVLIALMFMVTALIIWSR